MPRVHCNPRLSCTDNFLGDGMYILFASIRTIRAVSVGLIATE